MTLGKRPDNAFNAGELCFGARTGMTICRQHAVAGDGQCGSASFDKVRKRVGFAGREVILDDERWRITGLDGAVWRKCISGINLVPQFLVSRDMRFRHGDPVMLCREPHPTLEEQRALRAIDRTHHGCGNRAYIGRIAP